MVRLIRRMEKKRKIRAIVSAMRDMIGLDASGLLIAGLMDALVRFFDGREEMEIRSMRLVINGFFEEEVLRYEPAKRK